MRILLALIAALLLLSVGPGATASTSTPPRNGLIAVYSPDGIYVVDPRAGTTRLLSDTLATTDPAWSPDGALLAVTSNTEDSSAVYTMKPDGSERKLVLENAYSPSWSPDGKQLVVVREGSTGSTDGYAYGATLAVVDADGSGVRTLELGAGENFDLASAPEWSPDGKRIAFVDGGQNIKLVSPEGKAVPIAPVAAEGNGLSWSPDSSRLAFDRYVETKDGGRLVAVVLDVSTGKEIVLKGEQHGAQSPTWSPEGDQIAFLSMSPRSTSSGTASHSCGGEQFASQLWAMSPEGTKAHRLIEGEYYGAPSWARASEAAPAPAPVADEQPAPVPAPVAEHEPAPAADVPTPTSEPTSKPALTSRPTPAPVKKTELPSVAKGRIAVRGSNAIYLVDPDNAAAYKVPDTADMIAPAWSPDGSLLAVERVQEAGVSSIYTIRPDGTQPQLVLKNASAPSWSPAGDLIFVVRDECATPCEPEDEEANVRYTVRPDGSDLQRVGLEDDFQDPRELAWRGDGSPIWFFEDGSENAPGTFDTSAAAWSPDETRIAFIGALGPTDEEASGDTITAGLWIASAEGGTPQLLLEGASGWPSWP